MTTPGYGGEMHNQVCHQHTVGEVAYVDVPQLVGIARATNDLERRALLLDTVGDIVASRKCYPHGAAKLRDEWKTDYVRSCEEARTLTAESLQQADLDPDTSFQLLGTLAALHGHADLALLLGGSRDLECAECGEPIVFGRSEV